MGKKTNKKLRWRDLSQARLDDIAAWNWGTDAVVLKDPPAIRGVSQARLLWILFVGAWMLVPVAGWRFVPAFNLFLALLFWGVAIVVVVGVEIASLASMSHTRPLLDARGPFTPAMAARRALRRVMKFTWRRRCFDTAGYFQDLGKERAPRVVFVRCLCAGADYSDVYEEVDVCDRRLVSKAFIRRWRFLMVWISASLVASFFFDWRYMTPLQVLQSPLFLAYVAFLAWNFSQVGLTPFRLRSAVASVKGVTFAGLFAPRGEFNRDNSVLVVERRGAIRARLCRLDGKVGSIAFPGGTESPALAQLLARWTFKPEPAKPKAAADDVEETERAVSDAAQGLPAAPIAE